MPYLVLTTLPKMSQARSLARQIVQKGLAACVTIVPKAESVYRWQGKLERSAEHLLLIKTARKNWRPLDTFIRQHHPYQLPECIAIKLTAGSKDYLAWLEKP